MSAPSVYSYGLALAGVLVFPSLLVAEEHAIDVGTPEAADHLGYGWSTGEQHGSRSFAWIRKREADIWFDLRDVADMELSVTAAPLYLFYQRQHVGVYVNNRFLVEWVCPDSPDYSEFQARVPAKMLRAGRNRLILRTGYQKREGRDPRELALAVDRVILKSIEP